MIEYFGLCKSKSKDGLQGVRKTFGIRKDSCHKFSERSFKRRRQWKTSSWMTFLKLGVYKKNQGGSEQRWTEWLSLIDGRVLKKDTYWVELHLRIEADQESLG